MSSPAAQISVLAGKHFACVKIQGRANFVSSIDFNTLVTGLRERGFTYFVIELSECSLMDSTFLGVLAGFGLKTAPRDGGPNVHCVELRNANPRITELLENVGVLYLFRTSAGELAAPEILEACAHQPAPASREALTRACLEAHELLMAINPENVARFKDVTKFLAEDLARIQAAAPPPEP
jgi:anti-sigma B factor antagonist